MIYVTNLGMNFGQQVLFDNVCFQLNQGNKYGLVGANGSGKSTLLKILSREIHAESGDISFPNSLKFGILKQDHFIYENETILDVVLMGKPELWEALIEKKRLVQLGEVNNETGEKLADLEMKILDFDGYQAEAEASELLDGLGISKSKQSDPLKSLSGGYKLRTLLAQCLFSEPDFLLLDEPTNHLDLGSIQWLEEYLGNFKGTCLIISHDQYFINRTSTHIIDIDYQTIRIYPGNYQDFLKAKELEVVQKEKEIGKQEKKKEELQQFVDRFKAKATKARQANSKAKQLDKMDDIVIQRTSRLAPNFDFKIQRPSGKVAFSVNSLSKSFQGNEVLKDISFSLQRGEKIAVIGPNGIGKSTLLKILAEKMNPSSGDAEMGYEIFRGYCPQDHQDVIPKNTTPYEWLYSFAPGETIGTIRGLLGRVLLKGDDVKKSTESLSGGESARLIFAMLMLLKPNLFLLDEPTNHMDIESLEALSKALCKYEGSIVCVSHDRRFIETFATSILELRADGLELFSGGYQEYVEKHGKDYLDRSMVRSLKMEGGSTKKVLTGSKEWRKATKQISKFKKAVKDREEKISKIENEIDGIEEQLANNKLYQPECKKELDQILSLKKNLDEKLNTEIEEWEEAQTELDKVSSSTS